MSPTNYFYPKGQWRKQTNSVPVCVERVVTVLLCVMTGVSALEGLVCLAIGRAPGSGPSRLLSRWLSLLHVVFWRTPRVTVRIYHQFPGGAHLDPPMKKNNYLSPLSFAVCFPLVAGQRCHTKTCNTLIRRSAVHKLLFGVATHVLADRNFRPQSQRRRAGGGPVASQKTAFVWYSGKTENPACAPHATRLKFWAPRHGGGRLRRQICNFLFNGSRWDALCPEKDNKTSLPTRELISFRNGIKI